MRFKQTNGQEFKEWCKCEYPNTFIAEIGKVTESEMFYSNGVKVTQILLEIDLRRISTNKTSNQNIMLSLLSSVQLWDHTLENRTTILTGISIIIYYDVFTIDMFSLILG